LPGSQGVAGTVAGEPITSGEGALVTPVEIAIANRVADAAKGALAYLVRRRHPRLDDAERLILQAAGEAEQAAIEAVRPLARTLSEAQSRALTSYLGSGEFLALVGQVLAMRLLHGKEFREVAAKPIATLAAGLRLYLPASQATRAGDVAEPLLAAVIAATDGIVAANERKLRRLLAEPAFVDLLRSHEAVIPKTVEALVDTATPREALEWIERYAAATKARWSRVRAPHFDAQVTVPLDRVYVPARLHLLEDASAEETAAVRARRRPAVERRFERVADPVERLRAIDRTLREEFDEDPRARMYDELSIDRMVVLGDPGAGKTTLAIRIAGEVLAGRRNDPGGRFSPSLAFMVTLRDFTVKSRKSFVRYLEDSAEGDFQLPPPRGLLEFLLLNGRALVVFDGLDELVDTARRREISDAIESFAVAYPFAPIFVTSRHVGYDRAPLAPDVFSAAQIDPFQPEDVERYVDSWFMLDVDSGPVEERRDRARRFMTTSESIADLRSNPLLLALLCNLYKATGFQDLPRSRPAVLEKCALVLFDRWDRHRSIGDVDFEQDFEPVVAWLAYSLFSDPAYAEGITESRMIELAVEFLWPRVYDHEEQARAFARSLLAHCRDRAWVFTDVGTTAQGERIYQFTHRTFMEYFCALYLCRTYRTPEATIAVLLPRIANVEWSLVPLLTVQVLSRRFDSGGDDALDIVLRAHDTARDVIERAALLAFAMEILRHVSVGPKAVSAVVTALAEDPADLQRAVREERDQVLPDNRSAFTAAVARITGT
jgi:hypothetical protein